MTKGLQTLLNYFRNPFCFLKHELWMVPLNGRRYLKATERLFECLIELEMWACSCWAGVLHQSCANGHFWEQTWKNAEVDLAWMYFRAPAAEFSHGKCDRHSLKKKHPFRGQTLVFWLILRQSLHCLFVIFSHLKRVLQRTESQTPKKLEKVQKTRSAKKYLMKWVSLM